MVARTLYSFITPGYSVQFARYCELVMQHHLAQYTFTPGEYGQMYQLRASVVASFESQEEILGMLASLAGLYFETTRLKLVNCLLQQCQHLDLTIFDDAWVEEYDFIVRLVLRVKRGVYIHCELLIKVQT